MIGGPQGSGINASAEVFAKACSRAGLHVHANIEYHSNIMGKHSYYRVRVGEPPVRAARLGYEHIKANFPDDFPFKLQPHSQPKKRILARGSYIHAIAKLKAGCAFQTYYPISPATDESTYLEKYQRQYNILVQQCEDEISSINMAIGAAHMGVRAATATSGPGFSLMVEGIGFASITEAPGPVLVMYQRGGPSTGLPTRQEQADLLFALHPTHGDFVHIVTAPGDLQECFSHTAMAFT